MSNPFRNSSFLISGGAGFVGSNLVLGLLEEGASSIHVVDNLLSSERDNLPEDARIRFTLGSIADDAILDGIIDEYDYIFHLSTYHGNQSSMHNPIADHDNNLFTTLKLLEHIKFFKNVKKVVYSGAGCAVAEKTYNEASATLEDAPISITMDSPYSISKIVGEFYMVYYYNHHQVPAVRTRFQNVYGPGEVLGAGQWRGTPATVWRNVTPTFIYKALHGQPLPLEGGGETSRDFVFVGDIVRGLLACAEYGQPGEVYNLASGIETSIRLLADTINELTGNPGGVQLLPRRPWDHSGRRFGSTEKTRRKLGFEAKTTLHDGLAQTIGWTRKNMDRIERCIHRHERHLATS